MRVLFLPSPLLGGLSFEPLAESLSGLGWDTRVAVLPAPPLQALRVAEQFRITALEFRPDVLVAHSNAGLFAPGVREGEDTSIVFMDAALPPESGSYVLAPPRFAEFIAKLPLADGLLPPWTDWWDRDVIEGLFPNSYWYQRVRNDQPRLAPDYFADQLTVSDGWVERGNAYLAFGDTYADEVVRAERYGWPTQRLVGGHMHHLHDPMGVASAIEVLASRAST